jgi:sugar-specific transcriptional regulator TrmB
MSDTSDGEQFFEQLDLGEYEATALQGLLTHGRSTAPNLVEATGIPNARIYGVLDELADRGFIKVIPGRPKEYQPRPPEEILERAVENRQQEFESFQAEIDGMREDFLETFEPQYQRASGDISPTEELFYVVDVGEPSESETRSIYRNAEETVRVLTKSLEYFDSIRPAFEAAIERGIEIELLFLHPQHLSEHNSSVQREVVRELRREFPEVDIRFSEEPLPWRGTLADPSMEYDSGIAIFLVEETDIPLHMRQAAVTENGSFVAGLNRYFELIWEHESVSEGEIERD